MLSTVYLSLYKTLEVQGLNQLCGLTTLKLSNVGDSKFESVDQLSQLTTLDLSFSKHLCLLPNLDILPNLREVCIYKCCSLENFISLSRKYEEIKDHNHHQVCIVIYSHFDVIKMNTLMVYRCKIAYN